jgi:competence protein ComEC
MCSVLLTRWPGTAGSSALLIFGLQGRPLQTQVDFLAIGQGDGALIQLPDGRTVLVDAGPPSAQPLFWLRRQGITHIDEVLISHPHPDHYGGVLPILEALSVGAVRVPRGPVEGEEDYARIWSLAQSKGVPILTGQDPVLDPQRLQIHHPEPSFLAQFKDDPNEISLVLELRDGGHRVLFTGDVEDAGEHALSALNLGPIDVLKVAHHGSHTSSNPRLMAQWQPRLAVISCGVDNRFRHPRPQTLWTHRAWPVLRTDQDGTVQLSLGPELRVRTWKGTWSAWQGLPAKPSQRLD